MTRLYHCTQLQAYYRVTPSTSHPGRWLVGHNVPGCPMALAVDEDCPSEAAARARRLQLEAQRTASFTADILAPHTATQRT